MKFNILERIMILGILPKQADLVSIKIIEDLRRNVGFSQKELDDSKIKSLPNGNFSWEKDFEKEIKVTNRAAEIIKENLNKLSEAKNVSAYHLSIFEKFGIKIEIPEDEEYKGE